MATDLTRSNPVLEGFNSLSIIRQLGLMIGLAASIAIGGGIVMWSQEPSYRPLYTDISNLDASQIIGVLEGAKILYQIDTNTGVLMVQSDKIHDARLKLAAAGFTGGNSVGYELLDKESGFGTSQFMEKAKYRRSIEGELSKTITSIKSVRAARVHLAIPKKTVFLGDTRKPSASVLLDLHPGRKLEKPQIVAIGHLVASGIPELNAEDVTVVDQYGNLLSDNDKTAEMAAAAKQLDYTSNVETGYQKRIAEILEPLVGVDKYRVQVSADIDFTVMEQTAETFNPDLPAVRSEQKLNESMGAGLSGGGVPGALSNQPPAEGSAPEVATGQAGQSEDQSTVETPKNLRTQETRNFELDRTISHTRHQTGSIKRLTVAVVLDDKESMVGEGKDKQMVSTPFSADELERIAILVKGAVGFNAARGDRVNVLNQAFVKQHIEDLVIPEESFLEQPWVMDMGKKALGLLLVFILVLALLRPILKNLATAGENAALPDLPEQMELAPEPELDDQVTISGGPETLLPGPEQSYEAQLNAVKGMIADDPRRVAQVVKTWLQQGSD